MNIKNTALERIFEFKDERFYTRHIINNLSGECVPLLGATEFALRFMNGNTLSSTDFKAKVLVESSQRIDVLFEHELATIGISYVAKHDVLEKTLEIKQAISFIDYVDVECFNFSNSNHVFYPKKQADIKEMAGFSGYYVELGQPVYAKSLFFGMAFPLGENRVDGLRYFSRYYVGKALSSPKTLWPCVVGASQSTEKIAIRQAFFNYIEGIAQPSYFRKQYNSWYDHMTNIDEQIILDSFKAIYHGFEDHGVHLDAYVVDDGWANYHSVWDFNEKFPQELNNVKALVNTLGSSLGLWIGPRGGYNGTEVIMSDWLESHPELGSKNKACNDVNVADFKYLNLMKEKMLKYQKKYDISYWKIDGWLLKPENADQTSNHGMCTMTPVYEFLIDLLKDLRKERGKRDCWLNLTSYVNPSPWFLQWVNSLWIQTSQDVGFTEHAGNDGNRMITYRDIQYDEFLNEREIELPLWSLYTHEPIYASTANTWYMDHPMHMTVEEFENYLMFIATRGFAFWEFHYSYTMFNDDRWEANARAIQWIEKHYNTLKHSTHIGGRAKNFDIYGYHCVNPKTGEEILALRNPSKDVQRIDLESINLEEFSIVKGKAPKKINPICLEFEAYQMAIFQKQSCH